MTFKTLTKFTIAAAALVSGSAALASPSGDLLRPVIIDNGTGGTTTILAVPSGLSVYSFDKDVGGVPACYDKCAEVWPPVLLTDDEASNLSQPMGVVERKNGLKQLTIHGKPLYLFYADRVATDVKGKGLGGVWRLVTP